MLDMLPAPAPLGLGLIESGARSSASEEPRRLRELMALGQRGDGEAYAALLRECLPLIRRMARQNGIRPDILDDVVQDTLLTIHRARHTFDPARPFTPWLRAIVQRRGVDVLRRAGRQASRELHAPLAYEGHADPGAGAEQQIADRGRADRLVAAGGVVAAGSAGGFGAVGVAGADVGGGFGGDGAEHRGVEGQPAPGFEVVAGDHGGSEP